jgi:hypothetical protein
MTDGLRGRDPAADGVLAALAAAARSVAPRRRLWLAPLAVGCRAASLDSDPPPEPPPGPSFECGPNSWSMTEPPADLVEEGVRTDAVIPNWSGPDQFGDEVCLWQFYGRYQVIFVTPDYPYDDCTELACYGRSLLDAFGRDNVAFVTMLDDEMDESTPTQRDALDYDRGFRTDSPVLPVARDDPFVVAANPVVDVRTLLIGPDMRLQKAWTCASSEDLRRELQADLGIRVRSLDSECVH